jgi:hypothetical protein
MPETGSPRAAEDALYEVAPDDFVAARDALVKQLRASGDKTGAARVAKLRRPSPTVWVLNQLARQAPEFLDTLLDRGRRLRAAMEQALEGDASGLRPARDAERAAVDGVVAAAERRLAEGGYTTTDAILQRLAATARAAIVDDSVAERLRQGVLDREYDAPGFGMDALAVPLTLARAADRSGPRGPAAVEDAPSTTAPASNPPTTTPEAQAADARAALEELDRRRNEARQEASRLAAVAQKLLADADQLQANADRMAAEARDAAERAGDARVRADAAQRAAADARAHAERLQSG